VSMVAQGSEPDNAQRPATYVLVTIIISNYNYARFLREAIDSALNQTYPHTEVIVVDDGSTDDSREIIATYGDRIVPVYKENGGLASAINAGFSVSRGELICLLDSDDLFFPEKVSHVLEAWKAKAGSAIVYHQLQAVDAHKTKLGRPWPRAVWREDIRHRVERSGGWWPHPTTSALSFPRAYLESMLPPPQPNRSIYPDTYLAGPAAFFGPVIGLRTPLALYRLHGQNYSNWGRRTMADDAQSTREKFRRSLNQYAGEFHQLEQSLSRRLGISTILSLDYHVPYQRYRWAVGERVSLLRVASSALRCPALPPSMRLTEAAKVLLDRW
jgi:glycosyltransferase involved in cell wall biosynthesis